MCHYYKQLMITPLIAALIALLCFVIQPGWVSYISSPFSSCKLTLLPRTWN